MTELRYALTANVWLLLLVIGFQSGLRAALPADHAAQWCSVPAWLFLGFFLGWDVARHRYQTFMRFLEHLAEKYASESLERSQEVHRN